MRIAIANNTSNLVIATSNSGAILDETGHVLRRLPSGQGFSAMPAAEKIEFTGDNATAWQVPASVWIKASPGGYVYVGQHWYRGQVQLILQGASLLAVNHVNLDEYLYSVVGSEMPSNWPLEALKAQAIAARSYALAHYIQPANSFYHMGDDQAWQVYKGLDGEASSTHQAVNQTLGQFLSYHGGVVESLYADTDEIVIKAHGGLGMSQTGAMQLAQQGYDYLHILGAYYPGTSLARLRLTKS
jgi:peptidoglycan hydrolase-like amidase